METLKEWATPVCLVVLVVLGCLDLADSSCGCKDRKKARANVERSWEGHRRAPQWQGPRGAPESRRESRARQWKSKSKL